MKRSFTPLIKLTVLFSLAAIGCSFLFPGDTPQPTATTRSTPTSRPTSTPIPATPTPEPTAQPATIETSEDEPVQIVGEAEITFIAFNSYYSEPFVMLEDQAGFVARDYEFFAPPESQIMGPLFRTGEDTWEYLLNLPAKPAGTFVDVDNDGEEDTGVQVYVAAVQANLLDEPFLSDDEFAGWSSVWTSARIDSENQNEIIGGKLVVWSPDSQQEFPIGFGEDRLLFTDDDPIAPIQPGYTIVDLDQSPFEFTKEPQPELTLYEGDVSVNDYSEMSYTEAFEALWEKASLEYPFTEMKDVDWEALHDEFAPRVEEAEADNDPDAFALAIRDFSWSIPDGHVGGALTEGLSNQFLNETSGGLGLGIIGLDDGRVIAHIIIPGEPAEEAGVELGAEILEFGGQPIEDALDEVVPWSSPFSTEHFRRLQQYRYLMQGEVGDTVEITWQNPGSSSPQTAELTYVQEREAFSRTSFFAGFDANALPVEYEILEDSGYGYIRMWTLNDDLNLIIRLFERAVRVFVENDVPGVILDMRQNSGGSPLGGHLAGYFSDERTDLSRGYYYSEETGEFETFGPPDYIDPDPELFYPGPVAVLVHPACISACENVSWVFSQLPQARVVGQYPTAGAFGEVGRGQYLLPEGLSFQIPTGMELDLEGNIIIEGEGVVPDVKVPVTEETVFAEGDVVLQHAIQILDQPLGAGITPEGPPQIASKSEAEDALQSGARALQDIARESYTEEELSVAGRTFTYTVPMARSEEVIWLYGWCTATQEQLTQNWENITLGFTLDGQDVPLEDFVQLDAVLSGTPCRYYYTMLHDWPAGEHLVTTEVTFTASLDDGITEEPYPAGTRTYEYQVFVNE